MTAERPRISRAMSELKERRDGGELVHAILAEVAEDHGVSADALRDLAIKSWGAPLETDRERNASHFEFTQARERLADEGRQLARMVWDANLPGLRNFRWWEVKWDQEINAAVARADFQNPELERAARAGFTDEAERLQRGRP